MIETWEEVREVVNRFAAEEGVWGGAPLPIDGLRLTVEPRYPWQGLNGAGWNLPEAKEEDADPPVVRNEWVDLERNRQVVIWQDSTGVHASKLPLAWPQQRHRMEIAVLGVAASSAWSIEAELQALTKLRNLTTAHAFKVYFLSGMFLETSKKSGVTYLFRRLRPTLALANKGGVMKIIAALCLHPIGYYQESFAGCMVPTDDVIAHLVMCRGDEHYFWRKANQHQQYELQAGV